ncbi:SPRY domain-containing protein [Paenibacillus sp. FSL P4-0113]|uniref:SPRY domain-containing protein n=1 Tax=Paenibacillus sp. FSL P4-0113 TaxID=2921630 RepID=UPI0030F5012B
MKNIIFKKLGTIVLALLIGVSVFSLFPTVTKAETTNVTWSNGSLDNTLTKINEADKASIGKTTGKWYWEITIKDTWVESAVAIGITGETGTLPSSSWDRIAAYGFTPELFVKTKNTSDRIQRTNYGSKFGNKDVIGVALDLDNDKITWYKNGVSQGLSIAKPSDLAGLQVFPLIINGTTSEKTLTANFGASDFKYPIPEGFLPYQDSGTSTTPDPSTKPDPSTTPDPSTKPDPSTTPDPSTKPDPSTTPDPSTKPDPSTTPDPSTKPDPSDTDGASQPTGDRAILTVTMDNGFDKEFDLSKKELNAFIAWYDAKDAGRGASFFAIDKHNNNKGPFSNRKDYVIFNKILTFEVSEYSTK